MKNPSIPVLAILIGISLGIYFNSYWAFFGGAYLATLWGTFNRDKFNNQHYKDQYL